jgi:hypothetical protein
VIVVESSQHLQRKTDEETGLALLDPDLFSREKVYV